MKNCTLLFAAMMMVLAYACKPAETQTEEPIPAADFNVSVVKHGVKDYATWRPLFDMHDSARVANGISTRMVGRSIEDSNQVVLVFRLADVEKAKAWVANPELKTMMDSAGVVQPVTREFVHMMRFDSTASAPTRLFVSHKVKDFNAWLKVYDKEGRTARAGFGFQDRALGRGIDDPNMVYLSFAITDMEKAKARGESEELKALLTEAGVEGELNRIMFNVVTQN